MVWRRGPTGVREQGMRAWGIPGTWEIPLIPPSEQWLGKPRSNEPRPREGVPTSPGETNNSAQGGTAK